MNIDRYGYICIHVCVERRDCKVYMYVWMDGWMDVYIYVYMYIYIYIYIYIYPRDSKVVCMYVYTHTYTRCARLLRLGMHICIYHAYIIHMCVNIIRMYICKCLECVCVCVPFGCGGGGGCMLCEYSFRVCPCLRAPSEGEEEQRERLREGARDQVCP